MAETTPPAAAGAGERGARLPPRWLRHGLRAATRLTRLLGDARYLLGDAGGVIAYGVNAERRRRTVSNHRRNDPALGARTARRRALRSFREYGRTTVDFLWACGLDDATVLRESSVVGFEQVEAVRARGAILALTHHGNWDMAANIALAHGLRLTTVMAPIGSQAVTDLVIWARETNQMEVFTPDRAARGLLRALQRGRFIAILCDLPGAGPETTVDYCGGPVVFSTVPAWLAKRGGVPLFPVHCVRGEEPGESRYVIGVDAAVPTDGRDLRDCMQEVATSLERAVRRRPGQWYPFGEVFATPG